MKVVDYSEWELFSSRRNSMNYRSHDETMVLKTSGPDLKFVYEDLVKEKNITDSVVSMGIITPKVIDIVDDAHGSYGIIYENVKDKVSISRALSYDVSKVEEYAKIFAETIKPIHKTKCVSSTFKNYKDLVRGFLETYPRFSDDQRKTLLSFLNDMEDPGMCLHGDCHPGNFIMSKGTVYAIDLSFFSRGNPLMDVGCFYCFATKMPDDVIRGVFHVEPEVMQKFWDIFLPVYLETNDPKVLSDFEEKIEAYGIVGIAQHASHLEDPYVFFDILDRDYEKAFAWYKKELANRK